MVIIKKQKLGLMNKRGLVLLLLMSGMQILCAQNIVNELPFYFGQFYNDPQVVSSNLWEDEIGNAYLGHRRNSNNFGGVNTSIASFQYKINSSKGKSFNEIGFLYSNDNEGFLISRNRFYVSFNRHIKISEGRFLSGGASLGPYNFAIKPDGTFSGVASYAFDGSFLLKYYTKLSTVQFNISQAFNSEIQPILQKRRLIRNYNLFYKRKVTLPKGVKFEFGSILRLHPPIGFKDTRVGYAASANVLLEDIVTCGAIWELNSGMHFCMGINKISNTNLKLEFSYFIPADASIRGNIQQIELMVKYKILKKNKKEEVTFLKRDCSMYGM